MRTHRHKLNRIALLAMLLVSILGVGAAAAKIMRHKASIGEEYTCHFGRYGVVMIGWKSGRSAYIIVNGKKYSAYGGSDFFRPTMLTYLLNLGQILTFSIIKMSVPIIVNIDCYIGELF